MVTYAVSAPRKHKKHKKHKTLYTLVGPVRSNLSTLNIFTNKLLMFFGERRFSN